jgi:hypothetical protein
LPAYDHLAAWTERNAEFGNQIANAMNERDIVADIAVSNRVTQWAYQQAETAAGLTGLRAHELVPLEAAWRGLSCTCADVNSTGTSPFFRRPSRWLGRAARVSNGGA